MQHLKERVAALTLKFKEQESKREGEVTRIEQERNDIKERKQQHQESIDKIYEDIGMDT